MNLIAKTELKDEVLTLFFVGEINSTTASDVEKESFEVIDKQTFKTLILDFEQVSYVSSAGLRVILKIKQKCDDVHIYNATLSVYEVLSMTGFTSIIDVHKALNRVDVTNCEVIGSGYFSTVYRLDRDTIVKAYKHDMPIEEVERELSMAKQAFVLGIPTAISFDVVKVGDKLGVRFELLDSVLLRDLYKDHMENFDEYNKKYAALLKKINTAISDGKSLPSTKEIWLKKFEKIKPFLPEQEGEKLFGMLNGIEERNTFVHGDCHVKNIMIQDHELFLIDMDTLSHGHPIFELAALIAPYELFEETDPGNNEAFFKLSHDVCTRLYEETLNEYFQKDDPEIKGKIRLLGHMHMMWWTLTYNHENTKRFEHHKEKLLKMLKDYDDFNIGI